MQFESNASFESLFHGSVHQETWKIVASYDRLFIQS